MKSIKVKENLFEYLIDFGVITSAFDDEHQLEAHGIFSDSSSDTDNH